MTDNTVINLGSGGDTIAADDIAGVKFQRVKLVIGADGVNSGDVASGNPLPVSGTVAVTGVATAAKQPALGTAGTASADVISVQGIASGTALAVSIATAPVLVAGAAVIGKFGIDQTTPGTTNLVTLAANQSVNQAQVAGVATSVGNGASGTGVQRVTIANDSTGQVAIASGTVTTVSTVTNVATIGTSVTPGTSAAHLGKAEDAVAGSGDTGVFVLGVQRAVPASNAATGDYVEMQMSPANGLFVAPTPIQTIITVTPTISSGAVYASGDVVGAANTITSAASATGRAGQIVGATLLDKGKQSAALQCWIFAVAPTLVNADNGVFDMTDANLVAGLLVGVIDFAAANYKATNSNSVCTGTVNGGAPVLPFVTSATANLFCAFSTTGTPTYASTSDLVLYLTVNQF